MSIERISSFEYCWCYNDYRYIYTYIFFVFVNLFVSGLYCITSFFFVFFLLLFLCCSHKNLVEKVEEKGLVSGVFSTALPKAPIRLFWHFWLFYFFVFCFAFFFWFGFVGFLFLFLIKTRCGFVETGSFWRVVTVAEPMKPPIQPLKAITIFLQSMAGCPSIGFNWWCINIRVVVITGGRTEHTSCEWPITAHVTRQSASDQRETLNGDVGRWMYKSGRFFTLMGLLLVAHIKHGTNMASIRSLLVECLAAYC